jgi:O-antigen/teichoic acid export membrane protein
MSNKNSEFFGPLRVNILANYAGRGWTMALGFLCIPFYLHFLGIEAYGLVGFFYTLQAALGLLEAGVGLTVNRELARLSVFPGAAQQQRNLLRSLEMIVWPIAFGGGVLVFLAAGFLSHSWVNPKTIPTETVRNAIMWMGVVTALQFPSGLYQSGLMGLQRQVLLNAALSAAGTVRSGGAILILWLVSPSIETFFIWQALTALFQTVLLGAFLWRAIPHHYERPQASLAHLIPLWGFASATWANAVIGFSLTQLDKLLLSKILSLEDFGYYSLASTVASVIWSLILPVAAAIFPRFAQLYQQPDEAALADLYHRACQFIAVVLLPTAMVLIFFSWEVVWSWTGSVEIANQTRWIVTLLVFGTTINGMTLVAGYLQAAAGWPQLIMWINLGNAIALVPAIWWAANKYGAIGAATIWVVLNSGYLLIGIPVMHTRLLKRHLVQWLRSDLVVPLTVCLSVAGCATLFKPAPESRVVLALFLAATGFSCLALTTVACPECRNFFFRAIHFPKTSQSF